MAEGGVSTQPCRHCGARVSPTAKACPACGGVAPTRRFFRPFTVFVILAGLGIYILYALGMIPNLAP